MRYKGLCVIAVTIVLFISVLTGVAGAINVEKHEVDVTTGDTGFSLNEKINVTRETNDTMFLLWIQGEATNVVVSVNGEPIVVTRVNNTFVCNISSFNTTSITFIVTYMLPKTTTVLEKHVLYNTSSFTVSYDDETLFSGNTLSRDATLSFSLVKHVKTEMVGGYLIYLLILLIILLLVLAFYTVRKRTVKPLPYESEELLATKKTLLMNVLKEIEKKHRAKEISDESYRHLKDEYKRDAVEVMRKLEEKKGG